VCGNFEEFCSLLPKIPRCFGKLQDPWRYGFPPVARMDPLPPKPIQKPWFICQRIATAQFSRWETWFETQLNLFIACTGVACGLKYQHWPLKQTPSFDHKFFSVEYCTHRVQTNLVLKNPQKSMFTATGLATDMPLVVLGYYVGFGAVICNTQPSIY
jgi:hypothetical protein